MLLLEKGGMIVDVMEMPMFVHVPDTETHHQSPRVLICLERINTLTVND